MGRARAAQPTRLAGKLKRIRLGRGWTQKQMAIRLTGPKTNVRPGHVSEYETGKRNVPLLVLLQYARLSRIPIESLIDDGIKLPND